MDDDSKTEVKSELLKERKLPSKVEAGIKLLFLFFIMIIVFWLLVVFALS